MRSRELRGGLLCPQGGDLTTGSPSAHIAGVPIQPRERIEVIDVLRGFALFGILLVNMEIFATPSLYPAHLAVGNTAADRITDLFIAFFAKGRFYSLFSFLFGLGLAIQMFRLEARGVPFVPLFSRRLFILLGFGILHAVLIWHGDILVTYALAGFVLLLFRNRSPRTLLFWAAALLMFQFASSTLTHVITDLQRRDPAVAAAMDRDAIERDRQYSHDAHRAIVRYGAGSMGDILAQRFTDLQAEYRLDELRGTIPQVFMMFLLGLYAGRTGILPDIGTHRLLLRRAFWLGIASGAAELFYLAVWLIPERPMPAAIAVTWGGIHQLNRLLLCFAYASGIVLLFQHGGWKRYLAPLAAPGRMALSNYLFQSAFWTSVFYSYGLGMYGYVGAAQGCVLTCLTFLFEVVASNWWLRRYRFGPAEWVWRSLTYGRRQPFLIRTEGGL